MATEFISNSWLMPTNANAEANRVSNYSLLELLKKLYFKSLQVHQDMLDCVLKVIKTDLF